MKLFTLFILAGLLIMGEFAAEETKIEVKKDIDQVTLECKYGIWTENNLANINVELYKETSFTDTCKNSSTSKSYSMVVKIRTCETCIEMDSTALLAIIVGNVLVTGLIGAAVYSLSAQPKSKSFPGNKASDKVNLIQNNDGEYQSLSAAQRSEYSTLGKGRK